jgi:hypothetical protein
MAARGRAASCLKLSHERVGDQPTRERCGMEAPRRGETKRPDEARPGAECRSGGGRRRLGARVPCRRDATAAVATAGRAVRQREFWAGLAAARCLAALKALGLVCVLLRQVILPPLFFIIIVDFFIMFDYLSYLKYLFKYVIL